MTRFLTACVMLLLSGALAFADGIPRSPRVAAPYQPPAYSEPAWTGGPYAGLLAGYGFSNDSEALGGGFLGYSFTNKLYELGVEVDLSTNPARTREVEVHRHVYQERIDNWLMSLRGVAGVYVAPKVLAFGTAGVAWEDGDSGLVYGAGLRYDVSERFAVKAEVLRYEMEQDTTALRLGASIRLGPWN